MKFTVTKAQVIKALKTEPLVSGSWIHYDINSLGGGKNKERFKNNSGCAVCAVGGIIDSRLGKKMNSKNMSNLCMRMVKAATANEGYDIVEEDHKLYPENIHELKSLAKLTLEKKYPMSALSMLFEGIMERDGIVNYTTRDGIANSKARSILVNFVKSNFPSKLTIDTEKEY